MGLMGVVNEVSQGNHYASHQCVFTHIFVFAYNTECNKKCMIAFVIVFAFILWSWFHCRVVSTHSLLKTIHRVSQPIWRFSFCFQIFCQLCVFWLWELCNCCVWRHHIVFILILWLCNMMTLGGRVSILGWHTHSHLPDTHASHIGQKL